MSDQWSPTPDVPAQAAVDAAPADGPSGALDGLSDGAADVAAGASEVADEVAVLDELEGDLSAVEQAIESLERVSVEGLVGDEAAARIAAAVSIDRFGAGAVADAIPGPQDS
jgi:hypothetical protein